MLLGRAGHVLELLFYGSHFLSTPPPPLLRVLNSVLQKTVKPSPDIGTGKQPAVRSNGSSGTQHPRGWTPCRVMRLPPHDFSINGVIQSSLSGLAGVTGKRTICALDSGITDE